MTIFQPTRAIALRVALDLDIYKTLSEDEGSPKTSAQLAAAKNADPVLVGMAVPDQRRQRYASLTRLTLHSEDYAPPGGHVKRA